jgi:D-alanyl-D-alanine carboxypeptidase
MNHLTRPEIRPLAMQSIGDLYGTVDDVLRFGRRLFGGEVFDRPETAELMWRRFHRFGLPTGMASLRAPSWPIEYGLGMMRFELSRLLAGGQRLPGLIGHTGSTGSWLWYCPELSLLIAGTVDQTRSATAPFRVVPRSLSGL